MPRDCFQIMSRPCKGIRNVSVRLARYQLLISRGLRRLASHVFCAGSSFKRLSRRQAASRVVVDEESHPVGDSATAAPTVSATPATNLRDRGVAVMVPSGGIRG